MAGNIRKKFFEVKVPLVSMKVALYAGSAEELNGKNVKLDLTRSLRGKSLEFNMKIKANGEELGGVPVSLILAGSYVRRMMRAGVDYAEDSFKAETRDNKVVMKTFMIARNRVSRSVLNALRSTARKHLEGYMKTRDTTEMFSEIMSNKIQKDLSLKLKKIYPLALCEVRWFEVLGDKDKVEKKEETVVAKSEPVSEEKPKKTRAKKSE